MRVYELWAQTYPRSSTPLLQLGVNHACIGQV